MEGRVKCNVCNNSRFVFSPATRDKVPCDCIFSISDEVKEKKELDIWAKEHQIWYQEQTDG